jgi:pyruvate dehydrogenase (quinone)
MRQSGAQRIIGSFNNAAIGTALGQANGIQALDRSRQVIALCGDGGFNMLMCEFQTAVHHKLPVKVVVYNNSAFGLISFEAESVGLPAYKKGIEFPNPDFAALNDVCGGYGFKATKPGEMETPISELSRSTALRSSTQSCQPTRCPTFHISTWRRSAISPRSRISANI